MRTGEKIRNVNRSIIHICYKNDEKRENGHVIPSCLPSLTSSYTREMREMDRGEGRRQGGGGGRSEGEGREDRVMTEEEENTDEEVDAISSR